MWIESHQSLGTHLKLTRLARTLGIGRPQAVGHLHYLWWWAIDNAPDGDVSQLTEVELAEVSGWEGDAQAFVAALKEHAWLDEDGYIHDWEDYAGRLVEKRKHDRIRKQKLRRKSNGRTAQATADVRDVSATCPRDIQRTSSGHPVDGAGTEPNRTEPNLPNQIPPPSAQAREGSAVPDEAEVLAWAAAWPGDMSRGIPAGIPEAWVLDWLAYRQRPNQPPMVGWQDEASKRFRSDWLRHHPKARPAAGKGAVAGGAEARRGGEGETARRMRLQQLVETRQASLDSAQTLRSEGHPDGDRLVSEARKALASAEAELSAATAGRPAEVAA